MYNTEQMKDQYKGFFEKISTFKNKCSLWISPEACLEMLPVKDRKTKIDQYTACIFTGFNDSLITNIQHEGTQNKEDITYITEANMPLDDMLGHFTLMFILTPEVQKDLAPFYKPDGTFKTKSAEDTINGMLSLIFKELFSKYLSTICPTCKDLSDEIKFGYVFTEWTNSA